MQFSLQGRGVTAVTVVAVESYSNDLDRQSCPSLLRRTFQHEHDHP